jgi:hypothetical protein
LLGSFAGAPCALASSAGFPIFRLLWTFVTPGTVFAIDSASCFEESLETVPDSVTSLSIVAAVIRSFFRASEASSACTTSISICPSLRGPLAGAASCANAIAPAKAITPTEEKNLNIDNLLISQISRTSLGAAFGADVFYLDGKRAIPSPLLTPVLGKSSELW